MKWRINRRLMKNGLKKSMQSTREKRGKGKKLIGEKQRLRSSKIKLVHFGKLLIDDNKTILENCILSGDTLVVLEEKVNQSIRICSVELTQRNNMCCRSRLMQKLNELLVEFLSQCRLEESKVVAKPKIAPPAVIPKPVPAPAKKGSPIDTY